MHVRLYETIQGIPLSAVEFFFNLGRGGHNGAMVGRVRALTGEHQRASLPLLAHPPVKTLNSVVTCWEALHGMFIFVRTPWDDILCAYRAIQDISQGTLLSGRIWDHGGSHRSLPADQETVCGSDVAPGRASKICAEYVRC